MFLIHDVPNRSIVADFGGFEIVNILLELSQVSKNIKAPGSNMALQQKW
jgi:hypothetical protein